MDPTQRTKRHQKANFSTQYGTHGESGQASGKTLKTKKKDFMPAALVGTGASSTCQAAL